MTFSQLLKVLRTTKLSAEQLAPELGVSNMTIRRWHNENPSKDVPKAYERLLVEGIQQMVIDGKLEATDPAVTEILSTSSANSIQAALKGMGASEADLGTTGDHQDRLVRFLHTIGFSDKHRADVDDGSKKIASFKKMGLEWKRVITTLVDVVKSKDLTQVEKLVAYGALFYLLCPFDLVPDQIPVFGLTDDFAVLSVAAGFYISRQWQKT